MTKKTMIPPDGGWGWVIVFAYGLNHLAWVPIMQSFGLIFKDKFVEMGFSATDGAVIINTNAAASMMTGLFNGPLLKYFGYRKVSFVGAFFITLGVVLTAYANSFTYFLISYGLITSLGMGMGFSSYPIALNSYFTKRRNKAAGIALTFTGLGPILMPQLINLLLNFYDVKGAMLIIGSIAAHSFIAACLLQPIEWHMIPETTDEESAKNDETKTTLLNENDEKETNDRINFSRMHSMLSIDHDFHIQALGGSVLCLNRGMEEQKCANKNGNISNSVYSLNKVNESIRVKSKTNENCNSDKPYNPDMTVKKDPKEKNKSRLKRLGAAIIRIFDLELLKDPIYVNIMIGMSLAVFAELNFSLLTPFIMADFNLNTGQIAMFLSLMATADICFRFLAPYIGDFLNRPARMMYLFSLCFLILTRFALLLFEDYHLLLGVAVMLGIAKGVRTVYWQLVIPNYVPIEKLANANGVQMVVNGIFILLGGPVLGVIRDVTGSYKKCIYVTNMVTLTTIIMWTLEMLYIKYKTSKKSKENQITSS